MQKCLVIGGAMLDIVMKIDRPPKSGEDMYAKSQEMTVGGCAYNVAHILKHFQVPYTLFAPVGTGIYANIIKKKLAESGHDSPIHSKEQDNGYCLCMVEKGGERTFLTLPGLECRFQREWFDCLEVDGYNAVYVCGYEIEGKGGDAIIEFLEGHPHMQIYYAPGPRITYITKEKHQRIFALHPIIHLNEKEVLDYTKEYNYENGARWFGKCTQNAVIVTLGKKGAYLYREGEELIASRKAVVADTIGAGDAHIGTVIAMRQKGAELNQAVHTANKVSALVVSVEGSTITEEVFKKGGIVE